MAAGTEEGAEFAAGAGAVTVPRAERHLPVPEAHHRAVALCARMAVLASEQPDVAVGRDQAGRPSYDATALAAVDDPGVVDVVLPVSDMMYGTMLVTPGARLAGNRRGMGVFLRLLRAYGYTAQRRGTDPDPVVMVRSDADLARDLGALLACTRYVPKGFPEPVIEAVVNGFGWGSATVVLGGDRFLVEVRAAGEHTQIAPQSQDAERLYARCDELGRWTARAVHQVQEQVRAATLGLPIDIPPQGFDLRHAAVESTLNQPLATEQTAVLAAALFDAIPAELSTVVAVEGVAGSGDYPVAPPGAYLHVDGRFVTVGLDYTSDGAAFAVARWDGRVLSGAEPAPAWEPPLDDGDAWRGADQDVIEALVAVAAAAGDLCVEINRQAYGAARLLALGVFDHLRAVTATTDR
jgi:hypothetical protein